MLNEFRYAICIYKSKELDIEHNRYFAVKLYIGNTTYNIRFCFDCFVGALEGVILYHGHN